METVEFVVWRAECPRFFSRFEQVLPDLLPRAYAETARRIACFRSVASAIG